MKFGIIGAGPSGLTTSLFLKYPSQILEKADQPGGHASSIFDQGYTFDKGPHIMFSKNQEVLDFMIKSLGSNIHRSRRNNKVFFKDRLIKYPFENDLKSLPLEDNFECLKSYVFNPYKKKYPKQKNLRQWFLFHFGKGICEKYLFPYNEKVWNIPVSKLSMIWSERIPNPPPDDIIRSSIGYETEGYLHQLYYHYPLRGGYQALSEAWAKKANIIYNFQVNEIIKTQKNTFIVSNGKKSFEYDRLISTIPIQELIKITNLSIPKQIINAVNKLIINPTYIISLGIKGEDKNKYTAIYFPDKDFLVNRISFPKTFSPYNTPKGCYSIQAEIVCKRKLKMTDNDIVKHVINGLVTKGIIINQNDIVYKRIDYYPYAYVVYDLNYEKNTKIIRDWFPKQGIHLIGRFSYFEYVNVDMVIERSINIVSQINKNAIKIKDYFHQ